MTLLLLQASGPAEGFNSVNSLWQYLEVLLALGGVLVLAYVTLRVALPRMFGMRASQGGPIRVLARYPLEPKKTIYLVKAGTQVFLIGTSESQVSFLTAIAPESSIEAETPVPAEQLPRKDARQFLSWFRQ